MKLIIVESPHKSQTIGKFLGPDYTVMASNGHIRDLASSGKMGLGVDIENGFKPTYFIPNKGKGSKVNIVKDLKEACKKADEVYLASDPDREGEAISWHLAQVLNLDVNTTKRLEFHEITKSAVMKALEAPRTIDMKLVESQETRRIIDRLMGFRLSHLLQSKIKSPSAGRVQSVVLRFLVDREKEIQNFVPEEYWTISGNFNNDGKSIAANLSAYQGKSIEVKNEQEADKIISELPEEFFVKSLKHTPATEAPKPPFITATLQQEAFSHCHFSTKTTASVAQRLYEGLEINGQSTGLITYIRTDSIRLSDEFINAAKKKIEKEYGKEYVGFAAIQKSNKNVQDAHEAIRPTDLALTPEIVKPYLKREEYQLYSLIYDRAVASLMTAKKKEITTIVFSGNDYDFQTSSTKITFDGYSRIYNKYEDEEQSKKIPDSCKEGDIFTSEGISKEQHFTKAPSRYTEGKVIKLMQDNGVGRPSTYSTTITTLIDRKYVTSVKGSLVPTEQGMLTADQLNTHFTKYMDVGYTANMESNLDAIADGNIDRENLLSSFWDEFSKYYEAAMNSMEKLQPKVVEGQFCPKCGKPLVYKKSRFGEFIGCSDYPNCDYVMKKQQEVIEGKVCPLCGKPLVKRKGKKGEFIGCTGYPKCNYMEDLNGNVIGKKAELVIPDDAPVCPQCKTGRIIQKESRYGTKFFGCSNYPKCRYIQKEGSEPKPRKKYGRKAS